MKVLLLNPDLTYAAPPQMLQGLSGKTYAMSRWNAVYHCHTVEMSLEEFEKCWQDIQRAVHLQMRRWFPRFIVPERPVAVREFEHGYERGAAGEELAPTASFAALVGWKVARGERGETDFDTPTAPEKPRPAARSGTSARQVALAIPRLRNEGKEKVKNTGVGAAGSSIIAPE